MCNTFFRLQPDAWKIRLYYIIVPVLFFGLLFGPVFPAYAEDAPAETATPETGSALAGDLTDAYDKYAGGLTDGLDDTKQQFDGLVDDSVLQLVQAVTGWIPAEIWAVFGLSVAAMVVLAILRYLRS